MAAVHVSIVIDRTPDQVWNYVKDISSHVEWMADAEAIRFLTETTSGEGTRFECDTKVGPFRLTDVMTVTSWEDNRRMGVHHVGAVTGKGAFTLQPLGSGTTEFSWTETLTFPLWMGGAVGAAAARPVLAAIWRRNLRRLKAEVEARQPIPVQSGDD
jgi:uncharacterized membrane protein